MRASVQMTFFMELPPWAIVAATEPMPQHIEA
jgi:hypothetical protein